MSPPEPALPLSQALALGALHGPAELLPISSSGHTTLVPWLLGWRYAALDGDRRKAFEVALHAGTAAGLVLGMGSELRCPVRLLAGSLAPPALVGWRWERLIERRLGTPATIAAGLVAGGVVMALADRIGARQRRSADVTLGDALALGVAQALALVPGTSRSGMTLAAARARGFRRDDAARLSRQTAVPVLVGATALKVRRLAADGLAPELRPGFAAGAGSALVSTALVVRSSGLGRRGHRLAPFALYRCALAGLALTRLRARPRWQNAA